MEETHYLYYIFWHTSQLTITGTGMKLGNILYSSLYLYYCVLCMMLVMMIKTLFFNLQFKKFHHAETVKLFADYEIKRVARENKESELR